MCDISLIPTKVRPFVGGLFFCFQNRNLHLQFAAAVKLWPSLNVSLEAPITKTSLQK